MVILFSDATIVTEVPPLRACWSAVGEQAKVAITGSHRKGVLYTALNIATGTRQVDVAARWNGESFREHLLHLRRRWRGWRIVLFLDRGSVHTAKASRRLAWNLGIDLRWLPVACPELNPVESLWRWLKGRILSNTQCEDFGKTLRFARDSLVELPRRDTLRLAGVMSDNFWLGS